VDTGMRVDGRIEQGHIARDDRNHRLTISLPERGAAFDVREEKGDSAAGEIGHGPFPECRSCMDRVKLSHAFVP
jgi:hypothetical protein